jgi:hypothetical protein
VSQDQNNGWFEEMNAENTLGMKFKITGHPFSQKSPSNRSTFTKASPMASFWPTMAW